MISLGCLLLGGFSGINHEDDRLANKCMIEGLHVLLPVVMLVVIAVHVLYLHHY